MKCKNARILISAAADEALTERERLALDAHVAQCVDCRREQRSLSALQRRLAVWEAEEPAESLADAFALRLRREQESRAKGWRALIFPRIPAFGFASMAAVAAMVILYVAFQPRHQTAGPERPVMVKTPPSKAAPPPSVATVTDAPRVVGTAPALRAPAAVIHSARRRWVATAGPMGKRRVAGAERSRTRTPVMIALAPATADAARALAESEAVRRVTEKADRLRTLMAEADITVEGAILRPEVEVSASSEAPDLETDAGTPG